MSRIQGSKDFQLLEIRLKISFQIDPCCRRRRTGSLITPQAPQTLFLSLFHDSWQCFYWFSPKIHVVRTTTRFHLQVLISIGKTVRICVESFRAFQTWIATLRLSNIFDVSYKLRVGRAWARVREKGFHLKSFISATVATLYRVTHTYIHAADDDDATT